MEYLKQVLEASIRLELLVSELYLLYSEAYQEDKEFWWQLSNEEKNHASLLKNCRSYHNLGMLPDELLHGSLDTVNSANTSLEELIREFRRSPLAMEEAYGNALKAETSAAEFHHQRVLERDSEDKVIKIYKSLGKDDNDHANRISSLMSSHSMQICSS